MAHDRHIGFGTYPLECAALGLLMNGPRHGYSLYQEFEQTFSLIWAAGQAKFYAALAELEHKGHLSAASETQEGRPARKVYHITGAGREEFLRWLHQPVPSMRAIRVEFIARLRLFSLLNLPGADDLVERQIGLLRDMLSEWNNPSSDRQSSEHDLFPDLVQDFRVRQARFLIEWLEHWQERISEDTPVT
jgi:DNA-binding PadR family transcriptional regulator